VTEPVARYGSIAGPSGPIHVAVTPRGVVALDLGASEASFVDVVERRLRGRIERDDAVVAPTLAAIDAFLDGRPTRLERLAVDLEDRPAWDRLVLGGVRAIPWGRTRSYGDVARSIGRAGAARAVGGAVGRNPIGLLVPCHRVVAGNGTLGGFGFAAWGGREAALELKAELLRIEGVSIPRS
jgi:methylated-DNA-[protein]-cysteine S-methyltransferase